MRDADCTAFLQWALPQIGMHWPGFRKVRHQVCKRLQRRINALGLNGLGEYRERLAADPQEWQMLERCCRITISRFCRDRDVFDCLRSSLLPAIAERARLEGRHARCWSAGCASGEEPYSFRILWDLGMRRAYLDIGLSIVATDVDDGLLERARDGCYQRSSLCQVPKELIAQAFEQSGSRLCIRRRHREGIVFLNQDLRSDAPAGPFDVILCRYLAFTYFAPVLREKVLTIFAERLLPNGFLVVGAHEQLEDVRFVHADHMPHVFRRAG